MFKLFLNSEEKVVNVCQRTYFLSLLKPGESKAGVKYKGSIEVPNLSDENGTEDLDVSPIQSLCLAIPSRACTDVCPVLQISVTLNKDEPDTPLINLMKAEGAEKIREVLGSYVGLLKTGW